MQLLQRAGTRSGRTTTSTARLHREHHAATCAPSGVQVRLGGFVVCEDLRSLKIWTASNATADVTVTRAEKLADPARKQLLVIEPAARYRVAGNQQYKVTTHASASRAEKHATQRRSAVHVAPVQSEPSGLQAATFGSCAAAPSTTGCEYGEQATKGVWWMPWH